MTKRQAAIITALSIIAFILALLLSRRIWLRLDLTKAKAHTISKVSRNLHAEIPDYINITYYLSNKLKSVHPAPGEVEDTLREYAAYSRGKIRVSVKDPVKAGLANAIEELGFQPRQIPIVEQDQSSLVTVYSGLVIEYLDKTDVLPWVISTDTLEYDLTSRIISMIRDTERRIGVIVGDNFRNWRQDFSYLEQWLSQAGYKTRLISAGDEIPDTLPALFVLGGVEDIDEWALYRIDRYIQQGGRALFAVKGVYIDTINGTIEGRRMEDQGLLDMIASYGVTVRKELALDRSARQLQYQTRLQSGITQYRIVRYPLWIGVLADYGNNSHPVSARFAGLDLFWASPLELHPTDNVEAVTLFTSTPEAWSMIDEYYTSPEISYMFERSAAQTRGIKILGAALNGVFPSFFSGAEKPRREGSEEELPDMPQNTLPSRIIVIGDTDFATSIINATGASYNMDFLLRAADWLSNDDDIIGIRSRESQAGRLDRIQDEAKRIRAMKTAQFINVGLIPFLVIGAGLLLALRRRSRSNESIKENNDAV